MSIQAYAANIKAKTGKSPEDFRALAVKKNFSRHGEIVAWLKAEFDLGHGHASYIAHFVRDPSVFTAGDDERLDALFSGSKAKWRKPYDVLAAKLAKLGDDVECVSNQTYVNLLRNKKKFGIVQPSAQRLDVGIKLKGEAPAGRFQSAGRWSDKVTHRVQISDPKDLDAEVYGWLKRAYAAVE